MRFVDEEMAQPLTLQEFHAIYDRTLSSYMKVHHQDHEVQPVPLYQIRNGEFIQNNWNSGQDIIRKAIERFSAKIDMPYFGRSFHSTSNPYLTVFINLLRVKDENHTFIYLMFDPDAYYSKKPTNFYFHWKHGSPATTDIQMNGKPMYADEYIDLWNTLITLEE